MEHVGSRALIVEGGAMRGVFSCGLFSLRQLLGRIGWRK